MVQQSIQEVAHFDAGVAVREKQLCIILLHFDIRTPLFLGFPKDAGAFLHFTAFPAILIPCSVFYDHLYFTMVYLTSTFSPAAAVRSNSAGLGR